MAEEQNKKRGKNFDVFISYRRSDGTVKAKALDLAFSIDDCRTFLDFKSLGTGPFDKRLENAVLDAPIFIMVLTPDYFVRCNEDGDWVRREIELALDNGKIIIPINYDAVLNGVPDYLDEEFKNRVGCHNFVNLHGDNTFDATIRDIFDKHIRPHVSTHSNNDGKAKVSVKTDADCELILDDEIIATVQADKTKQVFVERGEHFFTARSTEFPQVKEEIEKTIDDLSFKYSLKIKIEDRVKPLREEEERRRKAEEIKQAVRRLVQKPTAHPKTLTGHYYNVYSVAASPDGKYLVSGSEDSTLIIWDAKSGKKLKTLKGDFSIVNSVCWSPDGKYLASGSKDYTVIIWDAKSGEKLKTLEGHSWYVNSVCWSPDGKYLASGSLDETVIIWDANSGEIIKTLEGHSSYVKSVCWSPDGKYLAGGSGGKTIIIWDAESGQIIKTLEGHSNFVNSVCWSPDGKYLASGSVDQNGDRDIAELFIWDAKSGQRLKTLEGHSSYVYSVCWSPDGRYLASVSEDHTIKIWGVD